jgi:hypothetical protein
VTQAQLGDARDKAKNSRDGAVRAVRTAWSHVLFPVESSEAGKPFDLDRRFIPAGAGTHHRHRGHRPRGRFIPAGAGNTIAG